MREFALPATVLGDIWYGGPFNNDQSVIVCDCLPTDSWSTCDLQPIN